MPDWVLLLIIGLSAGVFSGLFGIGGGVIIVPVLLIAFPTMTTVQAVATSLAALLLPVGILAVIAYYRAKLIDLRASALIAIGLLTTTLIGAQIALGLDAIALRRLYAVFLFYIGWRFVEPRKLIRQWRAPAAVTSAGITMGTTEEEEATTTPDVPWYVILGVGLVAGVFSGLFGIGGGAVIVPALVAILHFDQKLAVGTSLGALLLPVGLPGVIAYSNAGQLDITMAIPVAIGLAFGALVGARIALGLPSKTVKRMYGVFLWVIAIRFLDIPGLIALLTGG